MAERALDRTSVDALDGIAAEVVTAVEAVFALMSSLADGLQRVWQTSGGSPLTESDLATVRPDVYHVLSVVDSLTGAGYVFADDTLDFAGRHIEWWQRAGDGFAQIAFDVDPKSPTGYDYHAKDWFRRGIDEQRRAIAGPLIDLQCSSHAVLTFTEPVVVDGQVIAVSAVDLLVGAFQAGLASALGALDLACVLVNQDRRVVASNDARWIEGDRLQSMPIVGEGWERVIPVHPDLGWRLAATQDQP